MSKKPKEIKIGKEPNVSKQPRHKENPNSYLSKHPSWHFSRCDKEHQKWGVTANKIDGELLEKLENFEKMTQSEILKASGGRSSGNNNHFIGVDKIDKAAQERLIELKLYDFEEVFSLRLTGKKRLFGLLLPDGIFKILWLDKEHEICKIKK